MAQHVPGGGGLGRGAGGDDDPPPNNNRMNPLGFQFKDWRVGNQNLSAPTTISIINDDALIIIYLQESGRVEENELQVYVIPATYANQSERAMAALRALIVHYNAMAVGRRKYLYLVVRTIKGEGRKGDDELCDQLLDQFFIQKDQVYDYLCEVKNPKPKFSRMPEVFNSLPRVKPKK